MLHGRLRTISLGGASNSGLVGLATAGFFCPSAALLCLGSAMSILMFLPFHFFLSKTFLASLASSASAKVTKPKPLDSLVFWSTTTVACLTGKYWEKKSVRDSLVASGGRERTKSDRLSSTLGFLEVGVIEP